MRTDLRVKHDVETQRRASELFERGYGRISTAKALRVPRQTVEKWQQIYRAIGREALLSMGGKQASYTYEQKVAAASAVVDGGATKAEAMAEFGIMSLAPLERWCRLYREGGAESNLLEPARTCSNQEALAASAMLIVRQKALVKSWCKVGVNLVTQLSGSPCKPSQTESAPSCRTFAAR